MSKNFYVYRITNLKNSKIYIGRRSTIKNIEDDKYMGSGIHIKNSINKYGKNNFKKEVLEVCNSFNKLCKAEEDWIKILNATNPKIGYNISMKSKGAGVGKNNSFYGKKHTQKSKDKISKANKGRKASLELRKRLSESKKKENLSKQSLINKSKAVIGDKNPFYGKKHSQETKDKMREIKLGKKLNIEVVEKIRKALLKRPKFKCKHCTRLIGGGKGNLKKHENACKKL